MFLNWVGEPNYNVDVNGLVATLDVGDNFVVNVEVGNFKGVDFWIKCCSRPLHCVQKTFTNKWGTSFEVGDYVVVGLYYQKWGTNEHSCATKRFSFSLSSFTFGLCSQVFDVTQGL
jgi:hypothetical protein